VESIRIDLLASDVVESMAPLAAERGLTLRVLHVQPATTMGDAARLIQVIMAWSTMPSLTLNPGGDVALSVATRSSYVDISVRDTVSALLRPTLNTFLNAFIAPIPPAQKWPVVAASASLLSIGLFTPTRALSM